MELIPSKFPHLAIKAIAPLICITFVGCVSRRGQDLASEIQRNQDLELPSQASAEANLPSEQFAASDSHFWWEALEDETLNSLIRIAHEQSWDIRIGATRLQEALSGLRSSRAALLPSVDLSLEETVNEFDVDSNEFQRETLRFTTDLNLNAVWQIDVFGQARAALKDTKYEVAANEELLRDLKRIVTSQVATTYLQLRSTQAQISLAEQSEARRADNLGRIDSLLEKGYATALDFSRTESQLYQSRATLAGLKANEVQLTNQLSILLGISLVEVRSLIPSGPLVQPPQKTPPPSVEQLIYNRPDIRATEHRLYSGAYRLNAAKASRLPSLSLSSQIGSSASETGQLPSLERITANMIGSLVTPLLGRGRILAAIDLQSAQLQAAYLNYERGIANALAEIDSALFSLSQSHEILRLRTLESNSARRAAELSHRLFLAGELDYTSVIVAEQTRSNAESNAIAAQRDALTAYVNYVSVVSPRW
ncbi:outer membrane efflux protein [Verrucomicrobiia bacterium DG1235]|nr:outer membrane efflux protein [Verrucomicrobiae bacterium DG1235]